ncbi:MAG: hypothetical protein AAGA56_24325 [Myxococcota bacterium]
MSEWTMRERAMPVWTTKVRTIKVLALSFRTVETRAMIRAFLLGSLLLTQSGCFTLGLAAGGNFSDCEANRDCGESVGLAIGADVATVALAVAGAAWGTDSDVFGDDDEDGAWATPPASAEREPPLVVGTEGRTDRASGRPAPWRHGPTRARSRRGPTEAKASRRRSPTSAISEPRR